MFLKLGCLLKHASEGVFIDSIQIGSIKTAEIEPNFKNLEPIGLLPIILVKDSILTIIKI